MVQEKRLYIKKSHTENTQSKNQERSEGSDSDGNLEQLRDGCRENAIIWHIL